MRLIFKTVVGLLLLVTASGVLANDVSTPNRPTLFLIADSTVNNSTRGLQGWGTPLAAFFDTNKIRVENDAIGGRSSRSFFTEGRWDKVPA